MLKDPELTALIQQAAQLCKLARQAAQSGDQTRAAELRAKADEIWNKIEEEK